MEQTRAAKFRMEKAAKEERLRKTIEEYGLKKEGELKYPIKLIQKFSEAIHQYPDLKELPIKLAIIGAEFRNEQANSYHVDLVGELADARCCIQINNDKWKQPNIPEDLPALNFMKECVICAEEKKGISMCQSCWQRIRKALEIKSKEIRPGWDGYGYECNGLLDLSNVIDLLGLKQIKEETQIELEVKQPDRIR